MCGRGASTFSADRFRRAGGPDARGRRLDKLRTRYNLGPQGWAAVVRTRRGGGGGEGTGGGGEGGEVEASCDDAKKNETTTHTSQTYREVVAMKWGLVPSFAKQKEDYDLFKGGASTFNARLEGLESSGLWRRLLEKQRCVVMFDGFYEWKTVGKNKVPMFIRNSDKFTGHAIPPVSGSSVKCTAADTNTDEIIPSKRISNTNILLPMEMSQVETTSQNDQAGPSHAPLLMAGLFDVWRQPATGLTGGTSEEADEPLESFTIVTMDSGGTQIFPVHDRSPLFLTPETAALWLDPSLTFKEVLPEVLRVAREHADTLLMYEVPTLVSNIRNDSPDCNIPKADYDAKQFNKGLGKFFTKKAAPAANSSAAKTSDNDGGGVKRKEAPSQNTPLAKVAKQDASGGAVVILDP